MAKKIKSLQKPNWKLVIFGAFVFVGLGVGLLTAYQAGADDQLASVNTTSSNGL